MPIEQEIILYKDSAGLFQKNPKSSCLYFAKNAIIYGLNRFQKTSAYTLLEVIITRKRLTAIKSSARTYKSST